MDEEKKNIFYKPENTPDRHYESDEVFPKENQPQVTSEQKPTPSNVITPDSRSDDLLDRLTLLLDIEDVLPESIKTTVKDITKILIAVTIIRKQNQKDNPIVPDDNTPEVVPDDKVDTHVTIDPTSDDSAHTIKISDLFPKKTDIEVVADNSMSLSNIIAGSYTEDTLGLKEDYVSTMYLIIQKYIQEMLCAANNSAMGYENLLMDYDGDAVKVPQKNLKHLHDTVIRNQISIDEEAREFSKTHSADNTLMIIRALETAYQQKKKYYSENYR